MELPIHSGPSRYATRPRYANCAGQGRGGHKPLTGIGFEPLPMFRALGDGKGDAA